MEGLEISEVLLSKVKTESYSYRWDSTYFLKEFIYSPLENIKTDYIESLFKIKSGTTPRNRDETLKEGVILLKTNDIRNNVLKDKGDSFFYIDSDTNLKMKSTQLKQNDVLINIVGATTDVIGRVSYISDSFPKANITQAMSLMRAKQTKVLPQYLFCFLLTKYNNMQVRRFARPTGQFNMNHSELGGFEIPLLSLDFQQELIKLVSKNNILELTSKQTYLQAENILLQEIDLQNFTPSQEAINIKSFKDSFVTSGRLDSEYYQKKYEDIENKILTSSNGFTTITNEFYHISKKSEKELNGYNYIEIGDVNVNDGSCKSNYILTEELPANAKTLVSKGDILISKVRPYRGAVSIVNFIKKDLIVSGAFTVLREKEISVFSSEVLKVLLRTNEYKELLLKFNVGTSYPVIKDIDVLNLPIPIISKEIQEVITSKIQLSSKLKKQSEYLLEVAKKAVEIAIEENETIALTYISKNIT